MFVLKYQNIKLIWKWLWLDFKLLFSLFFRCLFSFLFTDFYPFFFCFSFRFPSSVFIPLLSVSLNLVMIRLQVPRLALRQRLSVLSGGVCRPAHWRRRPIAFLCYVLSVSTLRPLANRVRAAAEWLLIGWREMGRRGNTQICTSSCSLFFFFLLFHSFTSSLNQCLQNKSFKIVVEPGVDPGVVVVVLLSGQVTSTYRCVFLSDGQTHL